jgi:hypothetical protein
VIEIGAGHAQRPRVLHPEQIAAAAALGAHEVLDWLDDQDAVRSLGPRHFTITSGSASETAVRSRLALAPYDLAARTDLQVRDRSGFLRGHLT